MDILLMRCKAPNGVIEIVGSFDDATGTLSSYKVKGDAGTRATIKEAGAKKTVAFDGTQKVVTAKAGYAGTAGRERRNCC